MLPVDPEYRLPWAVAAISVFGVGSWAGLGDWSAPAIYGATFAIVILIGSLMTRADDRRALRLERQVPQREDP